MNLDTALRARAAEGRPVRVGLIGAGKFGAMFLSQAGRHPGFHVMGIADLSRERVADTLERVGWDADQATAKDAGDALKTGKTWVTEDSAALIAAEGLEVVIDATGSPPAGIRHALAAIEAGRHIVMVNVEADVLAGPLLARKAREAGVVYSMAYGDQPALISEMVDWARACGLEVVCAGKGTKYLPHFHKVTPDDVWSHYGLTPEQAKAGGMNPQMFNSFLDGTKSAIEMAAVSNGCDLSPPADGLAFPPCGVDDLPQILKPSADGGVLADRGTVEVVSSLARDGGDIFRDLRWGVYAVFAAGSPYTARCFAEYGLKTDDSGEYAAMYKPYHLIGLELGVSVASAALRGEPTGTSRSWRGDAVAVAKRPLKAGETLDGEGGYTVWGKLMRAEDSRRIGALPIGLAHKLKLARDVPEDQPLTYADVVVDEADQAYQVRRAMEQAFSA
ncbi:flagellar biosynthesis protein FlgA [Marivibrio halodurans]|uniref:Flagellar biosynthesis protein FlgA n=1 Tax=Marivibrio halodurans TaxID=2039722 RepID=A0A8J7V2E5_9PROT|nr:SAF domain-containing protein [Marivibrio halodurans]MBP5858751.1 flagellar biosynthesis protein FlgA [Marivibrio halodurans]